METPLAKMLLNFAAIMILLLLAFWWAYEWLYQPFTEGKWGKVASTIVGALFIVGLKELAKRKVEGTDFRRR